MFPSEIEINYHRQEMLRAAEHDRLIQSLRTEPTLWQRLRARLSAHPGYSPTPRSDSQLAHRDFIATSR